jgi:putative transposase
VRPAPALICAFIDAHRDRFGVVPICRALSAHGARIAPRTYWARRSRPPSRRALADAAVTGILAGIYEPDARGRRQPESLYGSLKMWEHLNRQGTGVARCTVERLMRARGWRGVTRARKVTTTVSDPAHSRAPDLVNRNFTASRPGELHVADFTYVPLDGGGFGYSAFCIDAFAGLIAGWECSLSKETAFVERAIRQAASLRARQGQPIGGLAIHHSDAGSYTSVRFAETLMLAGLTGSVGSVGDAYDNALAETTIGLYKTECTRDGSPFRNGPIRTLAGLEAITSAWVHWYNTGRLMHRLGRRPPAEAEAEYYARLEAVTQAGRAA